MESEIVENISDSKGDSGDESDSEFEFEQTEEQNMFFLQKYAWAILVSEIANRDQRK